ncbi:EndoU domain-containing protein [Streptomyces goshikiensis]
MIDLGKIPTFTGNLETLEKHATSLKTTASGIRGTGRDVHHAFQALDPVYDAPEQEELLNSTTPVRDKADEFAKKLESVSGALTSFASTARPLVNKMKQLREDAEKFVADNKDDDDWQQDQGKIDENARLVREVGTTWVAFQGAERDAANKITSLVGGTHFVVDDGSHKAGMYGFKESDVKDAKETPWGTVDEREYTGLRAAWEWTKDNVGGALKGFFVDGVLGTLKGLGSMVNVFDWDKFKKTWSGIGDVLAGVSGYIITPYDWVFDKTFGPQDHTDRERQKAALRNFGKSLVAWDEWGKDPSRAVGTVLFNALTIGSGSLLKLGRAGKLGVGAEAATMLGKAGALVDPMTYLGKATSVGKLKVGDFMEGLKASQAGVDDMARNMPTGTAPHPVEVPAAPGRSGEPAPAPSHSGETPPGREYVDHAGNKRVIGDDGYIRDEHGNVVRDTEPVREPHKDDLPNVKEHETAPVKEEAKVLEGAGGPSRVENAADHPVGSAHPGGGSHPTGGGGTHSTPQMGGHAGGSPAAHAAPHGDGQGPSSGAGHSAPHTGSGDGHGTAGGGGHQPGHAADSASGGHHPGGSGHGGDPHDPAGHGHSPQDPADPGTGQPDTGSGSGHGGDTSTPHQDPPKVEELPPLPKGGRIPEHTFEHVLQGELKYDRNGNPKVTGYHFRPGGRDLDPYMVKVPKIIEIDHKTGLTTGNVWMRDPRTGLMVMKRAKTTFFPPGWTENQVRRAMEKSFENARVVDPATNKWRGDWKGITFEGYFDPITGDAKTIYPLMP